MTTWNSPAFIEQALVKVAKSSRVSRRKLQALLPNREGGKSAVRNREEQTSIKLPSACTHHYNPTLNSMNFSRTLIIGNCGSGKSWLAERLAEKYGGCHLDLDSVHWLGIGYNQARKRGEAIALVKSAASQGNWIIEGIYGWITVWSCRFLMTWTTCILPQSPKSLRLPMKRPGSGKLAV